MIVPPWATALGDAPVDVTTKAGPFPEPVPEVTVIVDAPSFPCPGSTVSGLTETLLMVMPVREPGGTLSEGVPFFALAVTAARCNTSETEVFGGYCTPNWSRIA